MARKAKVLSKQQDSSSVLSREEIQKKAYHIWEAEGKPSGKDWDIWLRAEQEVCVAVKK